MYCIDKSEQAFHLNDKAIGIDWGKNGDKAVQVALTKNDDETFKVKEIKELK